MINIIKIGYLLTGLNTGGAEMMVHKITKNIDKNKFTPVVISLLSEGPVAEKINEGNIPIYSLGINSKIEFYKLVKLYFLVKRLNIDLLHTHMYHANFFGRIVGKILNIPVLSTIHNINIGGNLREKSIKMTDFCSEKTTIISELAARKMIENNVVSESKLEIVYNGIELEDFDNTEGDKNSLCQEFNLEKSLPLLLSVGALSEQKNYNDLIEAVEVLQSQDINCNLVVAGNGDQKTKLIEEVQNKSLSDRIKFIGLRNDVPYLMKSSDIFVLSSLWEGLPIVLLEALAASLPIVTTDVGGTSELVNDGKNGFLVPADKPKKLASAIKTMINLPRPEREIMGKEGRKFVEENFTVDKMIENYVELYDEILEE